MRFLLFALVAACGGSSGSLSAVSTIPVHTTSQAPATDLAQAKPASHAAKPGEAEAARLASQRDPRVTDLDIIRITATTKGVGGDVTAEHVATADLFKQANDAAKAKQTERAISLYRRIVADFSESKYAPISLFNIAALLDGRGDYPATLQALRDLVKAYPDARESIDGHLYISALQSSHEEWTAALASLDDIIKRPNLTYQDRVEVFARRGYILMQTHRWPEAELALDTAVAEWRKTPHIEDPYYIAMATYYRGELAHQKFIEAPVRLPDDVLITDLEQKRVLAVQAYDKWKESLGFHQAYWATASGYQMSQVFVELWEITVKAPFPTRINSATREQYVTEVHDRVRDHLSKALEGHRMNVELAKAYGVQTSWSKGSAAQAARIVDLLAKDSGGSYVMPTN